MKLNATNIAELYQQAAAEYSDRAAFATKQKDRTWKPITYKELYETGLNLATGLIDAGVEQREHVGLLADNRVEWIIADCGCQLAGAADVPRGSDVTDEDIVYILNHSDAKVTFVENLKLLEKIQNVKSKLKKVKKIILMDQSEEAPNGVLHMNDLIEKGRQLRADGDRRAEERIAAIDSHDLFTLIYTSGTTGAPKGVMLMHKNILSQIHRMPVPLSPLDRVLSILPIWHIFERVFEMFTIYSGACTYYTNVRYLGDDLKKVRPTFMGSAPRLWENIYSKILENVEKAHPVRRALFHIAYFLSKQYQGSLYFLSGHLLDMHGRNPVVSFFRGILNIIRWIIVLPFYGLFNASVLERLRLAAGGDLKASISGGGALPPHIDQFFNYIGIPVLEGYGMTETAPVIAARDFRNLVIGTVGPIFPDTELRIVDLNTGEILYTNTDKSGKGRGLKGEIHVRGEQVMKGYYKNEEATNKVLKDGWMNTGDLGMVTFNDCLKIMGRSKDTVVLSSGENVEPVPIENKLLESPFIDHLMITGQDEKFLTALVVPSVEGFSEIGIGGDVAQLANDPEVQKKIAKEIKHSISGEMGFKSFERVPDFRLISKPFEVGDELTNLFKLKRHVITEKYQDLIDDMYRSSK